VWGCWLSDSGTQCNRMFCLVIKGTGRQAFLSKKFTTDGSPFDASPWGGGGGWARERRRKTNERSNYTHDPRNNKPGGRRASRSYRRLVQIADTRKEAMNQRKSNGGDDGGRGGFVTCTGRWGAESRLRRAAARWGARRREEVWACVIDGDAERGITDTWDH
jgi:hypothetical protein